MMIHRIAIIPVTLAESRDGTLGICRVCNARVPRVPLDGMGIHCTACGAAEVASIAQLMVGGELTYTDERAPGRLVTRLWRLRQTAARVEGGTSDYPLAVRALARRRAAAHFPIVGG